MVVITWIISAVLVILGIAAVRLALSCGIPTEKELDRVLGTSLELPLAARITAALLIAAVALVGSIFLGNKVLVIINSVSVATAGILWIPRIAAGMGNGGAARGAR